MPTRFTGASIFPLISMSSSPPQAQTQATAPPEPESKYWTPHPTRTQARRLGMVTGMVRVMDSMVSRSGTETGPGRNAAFLSRGPLKRSTGNDPVWMPPITEGSNEFPSVPNTHSSNNPTSSSPLHAQLPPPRFSFGPCRRDFRIHSDPSRFHP
jgi:hypothetical protein